MQGRGKGVYILPFLDPMEAVSLFLRGKGKVVYILPYSNSTLALLLVEFIEYDDEDLDPKNKFSQHAYKTCVVERGITP
ncbi:hypothetical protein Hanom_Chr14g01330731 [Helianthus anomalus]